MIAWPWLFATGLAAGWIDSIAGGGGLITVPVLMSTGITPAQALATNKLQACFGSGSAVFHYRRGGLVQVRASLPGVMWTAVGALAGAVAVQVMPPDFLRVVIPFLLVGIALYFLLRPSLGEVDRPQNWRTGTFHVACGLGIGFYDGFFGPGTGSFWAMAYVLCLGFNLAKATGHTKLMNFTSNVASLAMFAVGGKVLLVPGLVMGAGQLLGARLGSRMVIQRGAKFIRPIFIMVVLAITGRLIVQTFWR